MNSKQQKTLNALFADPLKSNINGVDIVVHRPHPKKETDKGAVKSIRKFLINAGVHI